MAKPAKEKSGRKPKADGDKNDITITARIPRAMHALLMKQAKVARKKQSQMIRDYLHRCIMDEAKGSDRYASDSAEGLAWLVGALASEMELGTRQLWTECAHTHAELVAALVTVMMDWTPKNVLAPVERDKAIRLAHLENIDFGNPELKKSMIEHTRAMVNPEFSGQIYGQDFARKLRSTESPPLAKMAGQDGPTMHYPQSYYDLPKIRKKLEKPKWKTK